MARWLLCCVGFVACGRAEAPPPPGSLGGACYDNHTCDSGLVCLGAGVCLTANPCAGVTCSGHGTCVVTETGVACHCDEGYQAEGTACLFGCEATPHASSRCYEGDVYWYDGCGRLEELRYDCPLQCEDGVCTGECPPDMIDVMASGATVCVDRYEATVYDDPACAGTQRGIETIDDYGAGFPDVVESFGCTAICHGRTPVPEVTPLYACSVAGRRPSANITWYQAKRACENAGKRLCHATERSAACVGPAGANYPYGSSFVIGACNGSGREVGYALPTGALATCEGGYPGGFDFGGNLAEWVQACTDTTCQAWSGGFDSWGYSTSCAASELYEADSSRASVGFRCCRDP